MANTTATHVEIANMLSRYMKTVDSRLKGIDYRTLDDVAGKFGGSREQVVNQLTTHPTPLASGAYPAAETAAKNEHEKEEKLARFKNLWIYDDVNRAFLVALLDVSGDEPNNSAIADAVNTVIPSAKITLHMIKLNAAHYGGHRQFADALRFQLDAVPSQEERARELLVGRSAAVEQSRKPEWIQTPERRAYAAELLSNPFLTYELVAWAMSSQFSLQVARDALLEYVRYNGGRDVFVRMLREGLEPAVLEDAARYDLHRIPGYGALTGDKKRRVDLAMTERSSLVQHISSSVKRRSSANVSRVFLYYGARANLAKLRAAGATIEPGSVKTVPSLRIDFASSPGTAVTDEERAAIVEANKLREFLVLECESIQAGRYNGPLSTFAQALMDPENGDAIQNIELKWRAREQNKTVDKVQTFEIDEAIVRSMRARIIEQRATNDDE